MLVHVFNGSAKSLLRSCEDHVAELEEVQKAGWVRAIDCASANKIHIAVTQCSCAEDAPVVVYISKMMTLNEEQQVSSQSPCLKFSLYLSLFA